MKYYVIFDESYGVKHLSSKTFVSKLDAQSYADSIDNSRSAQVLQDVLRDDLTCDDFDTLAETISNLREDLLFSFEEAGTAPKAEIYYLQALNALETAANNLKLASLDQAFNTK